MKRLILALLILAFAVSVHAQEPDRYIKQDPWESGIYQIYNRDGKQTGTIKQDQWQFGRWNIDQGGKHVKTLKQDFWESDTYQILDRSGEQIGTIKQDQWEQDKWNIYTNDSVKKKGTVQRDHWQPDKWNIEKVSDPL